MNFQQELTEKVSQIEVIIRKYLPEKVGYQKTLFEAVNYSMLAGGKRIRPLLMSETFHMLNGQGKCIEYFMAAIEMIHTYSLVHDDLPAMDNDLLRRGRKTTHACFGHAMGILAGDGLLNCAFETMLQAQDFILSANLDDVTAYQELSKVIKAARLLVGKSGIYGMVGGQSVDVLASEQQEEVSKDKLNFIYQLKTGALIEASMMVGAVLSGAKEDVISKIRQIAANIGLVFQIQDDILDVTSSAKVLGKSIFSDDRNHKITYVTLQGMEESVKDMERLSSEAIEILDSLEGDSTFLKVLINWLNHRDK